MNRLWGQLRRDDREIAIIETTGGETEVIKLEDNGVRKCLLRLTRGGVTVEMRLKPGDAEGLRDAIDDVLRWTREP
jgi:hypothetical protein